MQNILHTLVRESEGMPSVKFLKYAFLRLNLEANLITVTENREVVNAVLVICTETKDSTLTSDHSWMVDSHPIHLPVPVPECIRAGGSYHSLVWPMTVIIM